MKSQTTHAPTREQVLATLEAFYEKGPGLDPLDYSGSAYYRMDARECTNQLATCRDLMRAIQWRESITAEDILRNANDRLTHHDGKWTYVAGQYMPTEYRNAAARVLASTLWAYVREALGSEATGDDIRKALKREVTARTYKRFFA